MASKRKRIEDLEKAVRPGAGDMIELITVSWDEPRRKREKMTREEYYRRYPERRALENDGQMNHVYLVDWGSDEPEKAA